MFLKLMILMGLLVADIAFVYVVYLELHGHGWVYDAACIAIGVLAAWFLVKLFNKRDQTPRQH